MSTIWSGLLSFVIFISEHDGIGEIHTEGSSPLVIDSTYLVELLLFPETLLLGRPFPPR